MYITHMKSSIIFYCIGFALFRTNESQRTHCVLFVLLTVLILLRYRIPSGDSCTGNALYTHRPVLYTCTETKYDILCILFFFSISSFFQYNNAWYYIMCVIHIMYEDALSSIHIHIYTYIYVNYRRPWIRVKPKRIRLIIMDYHYYSRSLLPLRHTSTTQRYVCIHVYTIALPARIHDYTQYCYIFSLISIYWRRSWMRYII